MIAKLPLLNFARVRIQFPLMPMGVLATGSAHPRPSARPPIDMMPQGVSAFFGGLESLYFCELGTQNLMTLAQPLLGE
jgi:hypothetical protein